jgi:hypothetical protein
MSQEGCEKILENDRIELLRRILERKQNRAVTYDEALEIGESLLTFYKVLADNQNIAGVAA